jgi:hypothetical protein
MPMSFSQPSSESSQSDLKQIPKRELFFWFLGVASATGKELSYTRLCKVFYLAEKFLLEKHKIQPIYSFEAFMIHTGVFDNQLIKDLQIWEFLQLLKNMSFPYDPAFPKRTINSHNITLTASGEDYVKRFAEPTLSRELGDELVRNFRDMIVHYLTMNENELILEANKEWAKGKEAREELVHKFLFP